MNLACMHADGVYVKSVGEFICKIHIIDYYKIQKDSQSEEAWQEKIIAVKQAGLVVFI